MTEPKSIIELLVIIIGIYAGIKITSKFIKFVLFMGVVILSIYYLLDTGVIQI